MFGRSVVLTLLLLAGNTLPASASSIVDSLLVWRGAGRSDLVELRAGPAIETARDADDSTTLVTLLLIRGATRAGIGQALQAESDLREARAISEARDDTLRVLQSTRWLSVAVGRQGRGTEAAALYRELETRAVAANDSVHLGWAWVGIAYDHYLSGRSGPAADVYVRAAGVLQRHGEETGAMWAWNGRAMVLRQMGRYDDARAAFLQVLRLAEASGDAVNAATALDNLGRLDLQLGDPGLAEQRFARSARIHREIEQHREGLVPSIDLASAREMQGRYEAAETILDSVLVITREMGLRDLEVLAAEKLADVELARGRPGAAAALMREILQAGEMPSRLTDTEVRLRLARALAARDSVEAAVAVLQRIDTPGSAALEMAVATLHGAFLQDLGRTESAISILRGGLDLARSSGADVERVVLLTHLGRALASQGNRDAAHAAYLEAIDTWEEVRSRPTDPAWRELRGTVAGSLFAQAASLLIDEPERIEEAWSLVQRYRARTLQERMRGPGATSVAPPATLALREFQEQTLQWGEVWVEIVEGERTGVVFCVTRDSVRAGRLPGHTSMHPRMRRLNEVISSPGVSTAAPAVTITGSILMEWPAGILDATRSARRTLLCPDGTWHQFPPALAESFVSVTRVPAAAVLASLRRSTPDDDTRGPILAFAGPDPRGPGVLPGAAAELRWLQNQFDRVMTPPIEEGLGSWPSARILHLAAHTELDSRQPWNTSITLNRGPEGRVFAGAIAEQDLGARLAVLTGCTTVGSRVMGGEGMVGLTGAFLSAGVPTVLATLWPVDDVVALLITSAFYEGLADGLTADHALARARRTCRDTPNFAAPRHWAGFTLVGEGGAVIPLQRRTQRWPLAAGLGVLALMVYLYYRRQ